MTEGTKLINNNKILGFLYVTVSAICFSSKGVLIKLAYAEDIDAISLLTFRMLFSVPFFVGIALFNKSKANPDRTVSDYSLIVLLGLIGYYFSSLLDFYGLEYVSAGLERLILFIYPTLVAILGFTTVNLYRNLIGSNL